MRIIETIKNFLGLKKNSEYVELYFSNSNVHSSLWVSSTIIVLELFMILSVVLNQIFGEHKRSSSWLTAHLSAYTILLLATAVLFAFSVIYLKEKLRSRIPGKIVKYIFTFTAIAFGIFISVLDYKKGEQFITFVTMTIFAYTFIVFRPIFSLALLSISYIIFFTTCDSLIEATYATKVNLTIAFIAILVSAIHSYHQKIREAYKDEQLRHANDILTKLSISDETTGLANMNYFRSQTLAILADKTIDVTKYIFLFLDVENFKSFNEKYGFWEGNRFLKDFATLIETTFEDALTAYFSNDNFVIFTEDIDIQKKLKVLHDFVQKSEYEIKMGLKTGAFRPTDRNTPPIIACDHARYACYSIKKMFSKDYCEYDQSMETDFYRKQYIINNLDDAIQGERIKVYYQPLIDSNNGHLCGLEALARWDSPEYGFLSPGAFIQTLEEYHQIHKLDMAIVDRVCRDIKEMKEDGRKIIPVSLNFSRLDFDMIDLASEVEKTLAKYGIEKKHIHVEITESALVENDHRLKEAIKKFRLSGYAIWLDDFGAGYSGLNVLKEYDFDMMKIDMKFLTNFAGNQKARSILKSIVSLANDLGMSTLTEGVETDEARSFLRSIGCQNFQGYLFGKPMPKSELLAKIDDRTYILSSKIK